VGKRGNRDNSVKKALERNRNKSAAKAAESEVVAQSIRVTDFQSHTKEIIVSRFADIIAAMAQKSAEGSLSHAKYLFEIGGVKEELQRQGEDSDEPTLGELLLAEVRRHQSRKHRHPAPNQDCKTRSALAASPMRSRRMTRSNHS
jgi:hypothetical protein